MNNPEITEWWDTEQERNEDLSRMRRQGLNKTLVDEGGFTPAQALACAVIKQAWGKGDDVFFEPKSPVGRFWIALAGLPAQRVRDLARE